MNMFTRLVLTMVLGGFGALFAINPQDSTFLDNFNDQQKNAIFIFLNEELGNSSNDLQYSLDALEELFTKHIENWQKKAGIKGKKKKKSLDALEEIRDFDSLTKDLIDKSDELEAVFDAQQAIVISE